QDDCEGRRLASPAPIAPMYNPVDSALDFVRRLAALAERLAKRDIVVRRLDCDWSAFGCWIIEASSGDAETRRAAAIHRHAFNDPGPEVFRVEWEGRDGELYMTSTETEATVMLNQWRQLESRSCDSSEAAIALAEKWLSERLGSSQTL